MVPAAESGVRGLGVPIGVALGSALLALGVHAHPVAIVSPNMLTLLWETPLAEAAYLPGVDRTRSPLAYAGAEPAAKRPQVRRRVPVKPVPAKLAANVPVAGVEPPSVLANPAPEWLAGMLLVQVVTESEPRDPAVPKPPPKPVNTAAPVPESAPAYVDRLIDPALAARDDGVSLEDRERGPQLLGRRQYGAEYRHYVRRSAGLPAAHEDGLIMQYRRETEEYGELSIDAQARRTVDPAPLGLVPPGAERGADVTVQQFGFALAPDRLMDNAVGSIRTTPDALLGASFRMHLPGSILEGAQSRTYGRDSDMRFFAGSLGTLLGAAVPTFEKSGGNLFGGSYTRRLSGEWVGGVSVLGLRGSAGVADHENLLWAARYEPQRNVRVDFHGLSDSKGRHGIWADVLHRADAWEHRYGVFHLPPNLLWTNQFIPSDQQGGYVRSEYRALQSQWSLGGDVVETNIADNTALAGAHTYTGYGNVVYRLTRATALNGSVTLIDRVAKPSLLPAASSQTLNLAFGVQQRLEVGMANFRALFSRVASSNAPATQTSLIWDQNWGGLLSAIDLSTSISRTRETQFDIASERSGAAVMVRSQLASRLSFDGSVGINRADTQNAFPESGRTAAASLVWSYDEQWSGRMQLIVNRVDTTNPAQPIITNEKSILFTLRYAEATGRPYVTMGTGSGEYGSGRIVGWIFFDDNNDRVRQASEKGARGVIVQIDGRHSVTTDDDGRFEFSPVPSGSHTLTVTVDQVPLPWGLTDDTPRRVEVRVRDTTRIEIPLNRITQ